MDTINISFHDQCNGFIREDYYCPQVFEKDLKMLSTQWHYVDHISNFKTVGDYSVASVCGESVILVLTEEGIKGVINMCRHRGSLICLDHKGNKDKFVCPYHGWQYNLDGSLLKAIATPQASAYPDSFSLHTVGVEV